MQSKNSQKIGIMQGRLTDSERLDFFPFNNWENEFAIAKEIGFNSIEWGFSAENWQENPIFSEKGISKIKELCRKNNISICSVCGYFFIDNGFTGAKACKSAEILKRLIKQIAQIGAEKIVIPFLGKEEIKSEKQKDEIIKNVKPCLGTAEECGVELAFETSLSAEELEKFIKRFNHPAVKVCYDTGNCTTFFGGKVPADIRKLGNLITEVHIKDRKFKENRSYSLGQGETNFDAIFRSLAKIKFDGPIIFEAAREPKIDNITLNKRYLKFIKKQIKKNYDQ